MATPFRPTPEQTPTFKDARRLALVVMKRLGKTSLLVWTVYADDRIGLHKFNANGSHKEVTPC